MLSDLCSRGWNCIRFFPDFSDDETFQPREHIASIGHASKEHSALIGHLHWVAAEIARSKGLTKGYRTVINTGEDGGQTVDHLHLHLLGGRIMNWPPG